jgi:hypothetical protein
MAPAKTMSSSPSFTLFTDVAVFTHDGIINFHTQMWADVNPQRIIPLHYQQWFSEREREGGGSQQVIH